MKDKIIEQEVKEEKDEAESEKDKDGEKECDDEDKDKEVLLIQDSGFSVFIAAPNIEPFELPVSITNPFLYFEPNIRYWWQVIGCCLIGMTVVAWVFIWSLKIKMSVLCFSRSK